MKCDQLRKSRIVFSTEGSLSGVEWFKNVYNAEDVDEAIAELKAENERLNSDYKTAILHRDNAVTAMHETEEYAMQLYNELRATRRALYKACANWAKAMAKLYSQESELILLREHYPRGCGWCFQMNNKWLKVEQLCRAKAEEYK